ncbi:hypothetical protein [Desulforamulus profundi]|uniref:hypothetical protein n=1 Tax=Desulforamulus profundi TaxID=1383067 RepID=UPI001EE5B938|nr:hypothetical protein [Desulforamulus profundi]
MSAAKKFFLVSLLMITLTFTGTGIWYQQQNKAIPSDAKYPKLQGIPILMYHKVNPDPAPVVWACGFLRINLNGK